ncbi:putative uncharacterized protein [Clostridium sp. CAG:1013]|nr:putative uncharacterized protein [Clostridium sp. CAG:1013]
MEYPVLPGLTPDGVIYRNESMGTLEAMLPPGPWASAHAPALLETPQGDLLCAWFAGTFEGNQDVSIVCSRLPKGGTAWTAPVKLSRDPERSEQNPSLFQASEEEIWAVYTAQLDRVPGKDNMQYTAVIRRQRSLDGGLHWGEADTMFSQEGSFCRQPIQKLANGRWIFSNWLCSDSGDSLAGDPTVFQISDDQGKTWRQVKMPNSRGRVHANVVELSPGRLAAFLRSREADWIYRSLSLDNGDTWTAPEPTPLPNNNSSISALKLQSGRLAIAYNPTQQPGTQPGKAVWPGLRCPVAVALSQDEGLTFPWIRYLELGEGFVGTENRGNNLQYEYPCLIQARDSVLHLAFAYQNRRGIKWIAFREEDILGRRSREEAREYNPTAAQL